MKQKIAAALATALLALSIATPAHAHHDTLWRHIVFVGALDRGWLVQFDDGEQWTVELDARHSRGNGSPDAGRVLAPEHFVFQEFDGDVFRRLP